MKRLLVAIDGCAPSFGAAKKAIELAERYGAEVIVLYVEEKTPMLPAEKNIESSMMKEKVSDHPLELMAEYGKQVKVNLQLVKTQGKITGKILSVANEYMADMIVIGDTARKGLEKLHFGSVAESVLKNSPLPVLVVKRGGVDISDIKSLAEDLNARLPGHEVESHNFYPYQESFRNNRVISFSFFGLFALVYFSAAIINSTTYQGVAAVPVAGIPLGVLAGFSVFPIALALCGVYLKTGGKQQ